VQLRPYIFISIFAVEVLEDRRIFFQKSTLEDLEKETIELF
jgi:hypothetical protein